MGGQPDVVVATPREELLINSVHMPQGLACMNISLNTLTNGEANELLSVFPQKSSMNS